MRVPPATTASVASSNFHWKVFSKAMAVPVATKEMGRVALTR